MNTVLQWALSGFLYFALTTLFLHFVGRIWQKWRKSSASAKSGLTLPKETIEAQRQGTVERLQESYQQQVSSYYERILQPREEAKQNKLKKDHYKFMKYGDAMLAEGEKLGGESFTRDSGESERESAARHRQNIDLTVTGARPEKKTARKPIKDKPKSPPKIELPAEPGSEEDNVIKLLFRDPRGQKHQRRFYKTSPLQLIFDYMMSLGFDMVNYDMCTSYPRHSLLLSEDYQVTLSEAGLNSDTVLHILRRLED